MRWPFAPIAKQAPLKREGLFGEEARAKIESDLLQLWFARADEPEQHHAFIVATTLLSFQTVSEKRKVVEVAQLLAEGLRGVCHRAHYRRIETSQNARLVPDLFHSFP